MACGTGEKFEVYPRVCGGTPLDAERLGPPQGLSPRVRGNLYVNDGDGLVHRSIPACAGEPSSAASVRTPARVYPRVCGGTAA